MVGFFPSRIFLFFPQEKSKHSDGRFFSRPYALDMVADRAGTSASAPSPWVKFNIWWKSCKPLWELCWGGWLSETYLARREDNSSFSEGLQMLFQSDPVIAFSPLTKVPSQRPPMRLRRGRLRESASHCCYYTAFILTTAGAVVGRAGRKEKSDYFPLSPSPSPSISPLRTLPAALATRHALQCGGCVQWCWL